MKWYDLNAANPTLPAAGTPVLAELADGHAAVVALSVERNPSGGMLGLAWRLAHPTAAAAPAVQPVRWCRIPQSGTRGDTEAAGRPVVPESPGQTHLADALAYEPAPGKA